MNSETWQQIDSLLDEYLDASPETQTTFFAEKNLAPEIKIELEKLIAALNKTESFIETPAFAPVKEILNKTEDSLSGQKISSYKLEKLIGKGGNGAVYLAKRIDDFSKEVAIKLIPTFSATRSNKDNFRRERQILARLEHENIARILDGGTTKDGTPYIVMEYIKGLPLDEYCRQENLPVNRKLELFLEVCRAVTFAHQNLIVHRDLKPSNILVTGEGKIKLLDFGIAKLLHADELDFSDRQTFNGKAFTPEYAAPEQINGDAITIASDVYSLGAVLYELLTEKRPHSFKNKSLNEILRIITDEEIAAPTGNQDSELDAVVLKSLAKNPRRRYQTAKDLQNDIFNYLNHLPISARPDTLFYRTEKYIIRHKIPLAVAAGIFLLLIGWFATAVWQTFRTAAQARENRRSAYSAEMILAATEYERINLNQVNELVQKYALQTSEEDLRGFEWYFLKNLLSPPSKITTFIHRDEIWNIAFSPNGKYLTTVSNDNLIRTWNVETEETVSENFELKGAWKCAYFPDNKRIAVSASSANNPVVKVFNIETNKEILTLTGHTKRVRAVDVSPDGKIIATGSQDGSVRIWNAETGKEFKKFDFSTPQKETEIMDVKFSADGQKIALIGFETLAVLDIQTWQNRQADLRQFVEKNVSLFGWKIVFSPTDKLIAAGNWAGEIILLDADKLSILKVLKNHQANVKSLAFSSDGKILASGSWDRAVKFFDVRSGDLINQLNGHFAGIHEIAFSPDGKVLATAAGDFNVNLWNSEKVANSDAILLNSSQTAFSISGNRTISWNSATGEIQNSDLPNKKKLWSLKAEATTFSIDVSEAANRFVFSDREGFIFLFNLSDGSRLKHFRLREKSIYAVRFSIDGKLLLASYEDGIIQAIDAEKETEIFNIKAHENIAKALAVSPDGKYFASAGNDKQVKIFDFSGKEIFNFTDNLKPLYAIAFSADGNFLASVGADDTARVWRMPDGKLIHEFTGMSAGIFAVAFSPDKKRLATASDVGVIRLWDLENGNQVLAFNAGEKQINQLKFSDTGKILMSIDVIGKARFWEAAR